MGEHADRSGRAAVARWLGVPGPAVDHVSDEIIEAIEARMTGLPPPASVLRDELLDLMKGAADRFRQEAETDLLTGLPNRRAFERRLGAELGRRASDRSLALLLIDVDGFKAVNDGLGHAAGDIVLREVGARLRAGVRGGDLVARWGGDEFMVLCREVREDAAAAIACKLRRLIQIPVQLGATEVVIGASIGWAMARPGQAAVDLIADADAAMYRVKAQDAG